MGKKIAVLLIVLSVALNIAFIGFCGMRFLCAGRKADSPCGQAAENCPLHRKLGVDRAQWRGIEPLVTEFRKKSQVVCREITQARLKLFDLLSSPTPDTQKIEAVQGEILDKQRRMQDLVITHILAEKELLTPGQRRELFELLRQRSDCRGQGPMMGRGTGNGACPGMGPGCR